MQTTKTTKRGGARAGSGAKPKADKLKPFTTYVRESLIEKLGREAIQHQFNEISRKLNNSII